jgi:hypothetical protein
MIYNVITPMNRPENIENMVQMLEPKNVQWHVVTDLGSEYSYEFNRSWIQHYECPNFEQAEFYEKCNNAMNWLLDNMTIHDDQMYHFLNDDDAVEPTFYEKVSGVILEAKNKGINAEIIIPSMERGHRTPPEAKEPRRHPPTKLVADPSAVVVGGLGLEQMLIKGSLLKEKRYRFPLHCWGDGMFIVRAVRDNPDKTICCPNINVWFNYFEPGRWDK